MKKVLITGANKRLGKTIAHYLGDLGFKLVVHFHTDVQAALQLEKKYNAKIYQADLMKPMAIEKMMKEVGPVDMVINTIGSFIYKPLEKTTSKEFEDCIHNNLFIAYQLCKAVLPHMRKKGFGRIINFGSVGCDQVTARPMTTPYYIAKTGLYMMTKSLAQEHKNTNITINLISPGILPTGIKPTQNLPIISFDDIAKAVIFLVSEESRSVNGANLEVGGGWRPE